MTTIDVDTALTEMRMKCDLMLVKMELLAKLYHSGVRQVDSETYEPVLPDNVVQFPVRQQ